MAALARNFAADSYKLRDNLAGHNGYRSLDFDVHICGIAEGDVECVVESRELMLFFRVKVEYLMLSTRCAGQLNGTTVSPDLRSLTSAKPFPIIERMCRSSGHLVLHLRSHQSSYNNISDEQIRAALPHFSKAPVNMESYTVNVFLSSFSGLSLPRTLSVPLSSDLPISSFASIVADRLPASAHRLSLKTTSTVSYTHLTLPTKRIV